jgi:hypothetical protein
MRLTILVASAAILFAPAAFAQNTKNSVPSNTPGHQMQAPRSTETSPGASQYAPGHQRKNAKRGDPRLKQPGASGFAPGQQDKTTGSSSRR